MNCPSCLIAINTDDWVEHFRFNDDVFQVECEECEHEFNVHVDITPEYTILDD